MGKGKGNFGLEGCGSGKRVSIRIPSGKEKVRGRRDWFWRRMGWRGNGAGFRPGVMGLIFWKLNREDAKFAKEEQKRFPRESSNLGYHTFPKSDLGGLGVFAVQNSLLAMRGHDCP
jgi:hypothetical protein